MQMPKNFNFKTSNVLKIAGLALVAIIVITLGVRLIGSSFSSLSSNSSLQNVFSQKMLTQSDDYYSGGMNYEVSEMSSEEAVGLSLRNISSPSSMPVDSGVTPGADAEEFEVTEYNANIETRDLENTCQQIVDLKSREEIVFENADEYDRGCNYSFKVKNNSVEEVLSIIESLDPKDLNANTYTIKNILDDYTSEVEILEMKMTAIEETLTNAITAYDDITTLATRTQDVESLAKIIDSKIRIIERLTQERINVNAQLERLLRSKAEQLDRLDYVYFSVNVYENKFIDGENIKDSWKLAIKSFVTDINNIAQDITINLVTLIFFAIQVLLYIFVILIIAKFSWKFAKYLWKK